MSDYLRVKNWSEHQHYAKRNPPWIKLYNTLIGGDDSFAELGELEQWQLVRIWLVASRSTRFTLVANDKGEKCVVPVVSGDEPTLRRAIQTLKPVPIVRFIRDGWLIAVDAAELWSPNVHRLPPASTGEEEVA